MKKINSFFAMAICAIGISSNVSATTRTVNNIVSYAFNPGQYNSIQNAITAANAGDTILVAGSSSAYDPGGFNVTKQIVLMGPGYDPQDVDHLTATVSGAVTLYTAANGSSIWGMVFTGTINNGGGNINNMVFRRNLFNSTVNFNNNIAASNILFAENMFGQLCNISFYNAQAAAIADSNVVFRNNVFYGDDQVTYSNPKIQLPYNFTGIVGAADTIDHNLFINGKNGAVLGTNYDNNGYGYILSKNAYIVNNIFYNEPPLLNGSTGTGSTDINNLLFNNIEYRSGSTMSAIPVGANFGSGNMNNVNPLLTTLFSSTTNVYLDFVNDNVRLASGSPCSNAGIDGTDIGPTGGKYPIYLSTNTYLTGEPPIPSVRSLTITSSTTVTPGTPVNVTVTAKKIN